MRRRRSGRAGADSPLTPGSAGRPTDCAPALASPQPERAPSAHSPEAHFSARRPRRGRADGGLVRHEAPRRRSICQTPQGAGSEHTVCMRAAPPDIGIRRASMQRASNAAGAAPRRGRATWIGRLKAPRARTTEPCRHCPSGARFREAGTRPALVPSLRSPARRVGTARATQARRTDGAGGVAGAADYRDRADSPRRIAPAAFRLRGERLAPSVRRPVSTGTSPLGDEINAARGG